MVFNALFRFFVQFQIAFFRLTHGRLMASMRGMPLLLLTTPGRKTHKLRTIPLMYIRDGEAYVVTASNSGRDRHPGWFYNLKASPNAVIEVPGKRFEVSAAIATPAERERLWAQLVAQAPLYGGYQKSTSRQIPMLILRPRGD